MLKETKKSKNKSLVFLGSFIIILSFSAIVFKLIYDNNKILEEKNAIEEYYEQEVVPEETEIIEEKVEEVEEPLQMDYIGILRIPKINLKKGFVDKNSKYNDIKYNVMVHTTSDMPDKENGNIIFIAHSGYSSISFFKNIDKLNLGDMVYVDYNGRTYSYKIIEIYDIEKTGKANIKRSTSKSMITLITCRHATNKQIVVNGELIAE